MIWSYLTFEKLQLHQLYDLLKLRMSVFIVEQNCVYQDIDDNDDKAIHVLAYHKSHLVAYSRIFAPGIIEESCACIGRILTRKESRGKGVGKMIVQKSIDYCKQNFVGEAIKISAQSHLRNFYQEFGFKRAGSLYLEDGIPHCTMFLT